VAAGREDRTKDPRGQLRTSHSDREQAIDVLKAGFVQGRLTKDEFDLRVGQVFRSRTYADLGALTADIPAMVTSTRPSDEPGRVLNFRTAARVGAVGAIPSMASAATVMTQSGRVPVVLGLALVGLTGLLTAGLLTALLTVLSWAVRRSRRDHAQGPPSGPAGLARGRHAPAGQLPWVSPFQGCGDVLALGGCPTFTT